MYGPRRSLAGALASLLLVSLSGGAAAEGLTDEGLEPVSILFVGNSLTYRNGGVDSHVVGLAASGPEPVTVLADESTSGSATLLTLRYLGVEDTIRDGRYDIVVLQGDIPKNQGRTELFLENARLLDSAIEGSGAQTVFFMTWPYANVDGVSLDDIVAAHRQVEAELDARIAPVGVAMERAQGERPELMLIVDGAGHTSAAGTYLAAATIYATLFERSPEGLPYRMEGVSDEDAVFLQRVAWEAVQEWQSASPPAE